jgi:RNA polymerase-binding protein DksA
VNELAERLDLEKFKRLLLEEKRKIFLNYENQEMVKAEDEGATDIADEANESNERRLLQSLGAKDAAVLRQINYALRRLEEGSYGICAKCGQPIPERRLELIPYAVFCVPCQESEERRSRLFR